jgi:hypothetical protein
MASYNNASQPSLATSNVIDPKISALDGYDWTNPPDLNNGPALDNFLIYKSSGTTATFIPVIQQSGTMQANSFHLQAIQPDPIGPLPPVATNYDASRLVSHHMRTILMDLSKSLGMRTTPNWTYDEQPWTSPTNTQTPYAHQGRALTDLEQSQNLFNELQEKLRKVEDSVQEVKEDNQEIKEMMSVFLAWAGELNPVM